jgi:hypothetical protein
MLTVPNGPTVSTFLQSELQSVEVEMKHIVVAEPLKHSSLFFSRSRRSAVYSFASEFKVRMKVGCGDEVILNARLLANTCAIDRCHPFEKSANQQCLFHGQRFLLHHSPSSICIHLHLVVSVVHAALMSPEGMLPEKRLSAPHSRNPGWSIIVMRGHARVHCRC